MIRKALLAGITAAFASAASAEETIIEQSGLWTAAINVTDEGDLYCDVYSSSNSGFFSVSHFDDGASYIFIRLDQTQIQPGEYDLRILVDRKEWTFHDVDADVRDDHAYMFFDMTGNGAKIDEFIGDLARGRVITMPATRTSDKRWSLSGSSKAMAAFRECSDRIKAFF